MNRTQGNRRGIRSVETGFRVLAALAAAGRPATLTSLGARTGLSPSQTHRYLQSLVAAGMAVQDHSLRYDLGPAVIRIGIAGLARMNGFSRAEEALARFVEDTGWTGMLVVWGEAGPVCVRWLPGRPPVMTSLRVGSVLPLLQSACGHVFLAFLSPAELESALAASRAAGMAESEMEAIRRRVRAKLSAPEDDMLMPGLRGVAAPIFDLQGRLSLVAAALATPAHAARTETVAARLRQACQEATLEAGGAWPA